MDVKIDILDPALGIVVEASGQKNDANMRKILSNFELRPNFEKVSLKTSEARLKCQQLSK